MPNEERPVRVQVRSGETPDPGGGSAYTQVWETRPEIVPLSATVTAASVGQARATFVRRYGDMKAPTAAAFATVAHEDLSGAWIQVQANHPAGDPPVDDWRTYWVGLIVKQVDQPLNRGLTQTPTGDSPLTVVGPEYVLRASKFSHSYWKLPDYNQPQALGWLPGFNRSYGESVIVGNRGGNYLGIAHFGGTGRWNHRQMLEHVVARYVQQYRDDVYSDRRWPVWTVGGPGLNALAAIETVIEMDEVEDCERLLAKIVSPKLGFDYGIVPTTNGFELRVFKIAPNAEAETYDVDTFDNTSLRVSVERSTARLYDSFEIVGKRMVVAVSADGVNGDIAGRGLRIGWSDTDETAYKAATGSGDAEKNDAYRADDRFRDVYQTFTFFRGDWPNIADPPCWPWINENNVLLFDAPGQNYDIDTLPRTPMREGYDYATNPPSYHGVPGEIPAYRPPLAILRIGPAGPWIPADQLSSVSRLPAQVNGLRGAVGARLNFAHNHAMAKGRWGGADASAFDPETEGFAIGDLIVTVAVEADHRVRVVRKLSENYAANNGMRLTLEMPEAELHILAPGTVIGANADGSPRFSPFAPTVIRDDRPAMEQRLDEMVKRYLEERDRTTVHYDSLEEATDAIGKQLRLAAAPLGSFDDIAAVTTVEYDWQRQATTVYSGQAIRG